MTAECIKKPATSSLYDTVALRNIDVILAAPRRSEKQIHRRDVDKLDICFIEVFDITIAIIGVPGRA